ncbi:hypothetical protein [Streptomyces sp. CC208A]|uniref:hypothetical protein n=1 Tax=Streptomyces sp. CC208A TaxID=3044573 RepID=UPI0024A8D6EE|nr:hypothetical protein [Streptomyces sp. CC208A]
MARVKWRRSVEWTAHLRQALGAPGGDGRIGVRVVAVNDQGRERLQYIDPGDYQCSKLAAQLADEWVEYVNATGLSASASRDYVRAVDLVCAAMDAASEDSAALSLESVDLMPLLARWERTLPAAYKEGSRQPGMAASGVRILIVRRDDHAERRVDESLARFSRGQTLTGWGEGAERDEFSRADKQALLKAAWSSVHALEKRLAEGWALAEQGRHPDKGDWLHVPDLLWGLSRGAILPRQIGDRLPPTTALWPTVLREMIQREDGTVAPRRARRDLIWQLVRRLYPTNLDLHAFRVLLMDATGHASEEVTSFGLSDIEFLPKGVRLTLVKERAHRVRHRAFRDAPGDDEPEIEETLDRPRREASAIVRRLVKVTEQSRRQCPEVTDTLFVRPSLVYYDLRFGRWDANAAGQRFTDWLGSVGVTIDGPAHIGRLRKSTKVEKAIVSGGRISAAADDHLEETFAGHYAQGTTLRILSGKVITTAQAHWFERAVNGPTVIAPEAAEIAENSERLREFGLEAEQADGIVQGELDMGVSHCKNPWDSPFSNPGELCAVAPLRCMECRNAWVLPSHLPQLMLLAEHLERVRLRLDPRAFTLRWGQSYVNLRAVLEERSEQEKALARQHINDGLVRLDLPLSAHVEFDA